MKIKVILTSVFVLIFCGLSVCFSQEAPLRTWTDKSGQFSIKARLVKADASEAELRSEDGKKFVIKISDLSTADRTYIGNAKKTEKSENPVVSPETKGAKPKFMSEQELAAFFESLKIPRNGIKVASGSAQPGADATKAFDNDPETIWHTPWNAAGKYPFLIDVEFPNFETLEKIEYLPRPEGENGRFLKFLVYAKSGNGWAEIYSGNFANTGSLKTIRFNPVKTNGIRFEINEGVGGFASAAEIDFFRADEEARKVAALFSDGSFSSLRKDGKGKIPTAELRKEISELKNESRRTDLAEEIELAETLLKKPKAFEQDVIEVIRKPSDSTELSWRRGGFPWAFFQPTGHCIKEGDEFTVYLENSPGAPDPSLCIVNLRTFNWNDQARVPISPGKNKIKAPKSGIIYIINLHEEDAQPLAPVVHFVNTTKYPFFQYGKTSPAQWREMTRLPNPYGMVEFSSEHVLITVTEERAKEFLDDPNELCKSYEYLMDVYAKLMGFSKTDGPPNRRPKNLIHLIEVDNSFMYATNHRTAYVSGALGSVINAENLRKDGWGPWHEIGHMHQVQQYKFQNLGEVTVNIFSLEIQAAFGQKARIDEENMHKSIREFMESSDRDYHKIEDVFMKLAMFWQLRLAFGDEFYPQLHRYYRDNDLPIKNDEDKVQYFIRVSSEVSGYDLTQFFEIWGLTPDPETRKEVAKYARLNAPIWKNLDFSVVPPKGVIGIKSK